MMVFVAPTVSVPEKTLEHWASQYIAYRFRGRAAMWWPTLGEDIDMDLFPAKSGKMVQLELKTTTPGGRYQDVKVDLGQLWSYQSRPLGRQPFYVFPRPAWEGGLVEFSRRNGKAPAELGLARSGRGWWFADWMVVLTTVEVCEVLAGPLRDHASPSRGKHERLVRFDPITGLAEWGSDGSAPRPSGLRNWRDFWDRLVGCGEANWPQLVRLPVIAIGHDRQIRHEQIAQVFQRGLEQAGSDRDLVTLAPDGAGGYRTDDSDGTAPGISDVDAQTDRSGFDDHRIVLFLDSEALS